MRGFWTKIWLTSAALVLPSFVLVMWISPSLSYEFFCKGDSSCFREWVSALSGWVAALAALVTIAVMHKHHRDGIRLQISPLYDLSRLMIEECNGISLIVRDIRRRSDNWTINTIGYEDAESMVGRLNILKAMLHSAVIAEFEVKVGQPCKDSNIALAKTSVDLALEAVKPLGEEIRFKGSSTLLSINGVKQSLAGVTNFCEEYAANSRANAQYFRDEWARLWKT